jgi:competence CoiA-like predicted nuclease
MFFALDINGNRVSALHDEVDWLRYLSKAGGIVCPECSKPLIYKVGNLIRSHFAHKQADCTYLYHEPETEEHIEGKILLFERLK